MKIINIISQHRRDFKAVMECEFCKHQELDNSGYDDRFYHDQVIPSMKCKSCGESTFSKGGTPNATPTKYVEGFQI